MLNPVKVWPCLHSTHTLVCFLSEAGAGHQSVKISNIKLRCCRGEITTVGRDLILVPLEEWLLSSSCGCQTPDCTSGLLLL